KVSSSFRETFGRRKWHGRETVPQRRGRGRGVATDHGRRITNGYGRSPLAVSGLSLVSVVGPAPGRGVSQIDRPATRVGLGKSSTLALAASPTRILNRDMLIRDLPSGPGSPSP